MRNYYDEIKLLGMLLTAEACLHSVRTIMITEGLYQDDVTIESSLDTAVKMTDCCRRTMSLSLQHGSFDD